MNPPKIGNRGPSSMRRGTESPGNQHPPLPPLAFRVGIVGHRNNRLESADLNILNSLIKDILRVVKESIRQIGLENQQLFADLPPVLRAVSPLAEGVDRIFAEQAIQTGYELSCPMPFPQEEYEKDFLPENKLESESLLQFRQILAKAEKMTRLVRFEMDGRRSNEGEAFRNNGQVVLNQSDLLLVVWDGIVQGKPGGTEETLDSARAQQIPVIWIDAVAPHHCQVLLRGQALPEKTNEGRFRPDSNMHPHQITTILKEILVLPGGPMDSHSKDDQAGKLLDYYHETLPRWNFALLWKFFRNLIGANKFAIPSPRIKKPENLNSTEVINDTASFNNLDRWLQPFYSWPDELAEKYADRYRSGFILAYLLASFAVGTALFPLLAGWLHSDLHGTGVMYCTIIEAMVILTILGLVFFTRKRHWHDRWLDYRITAESIRQLKLFLPLGGGKPFPKMAAHLTQYGNPSATWMTWYVQAIERIVGLPAKKIDTNNLKLCLGQYLTLVEEQKNYHKLNYLRYGRINARLHHTGELTLWLTFMACLLHLLPFVVPTLHLSGGFVNGLTFFCGFLPALGASMAGINHQGEFKKISKNSMAMFEQFSILENDTARLLKDLENCKYGYGESQLAKVTGLARTIANLMINEVSDWKVVYQDRPPALPA